MSPQAVTAEATLQAYIDAFAELYGGRDAVYALDSVGGAYIFGAPEAAIPIGDYVRDEHGPELAGEVLQAVIDRTNEYLEAAQADIEADIDDAAEVIDPDWANNHNRKYKAPLSIHKDHAAVVTPLDVDDVDYRMTPLDAVNDDLIADAREWADAFTAVEHTDRAADLVATLWADEYAEHGDWRAALDTWVAEREAEREARERRQALRTDDEPDRDRDLNLEDLDITPYVDDVKHAVDQLDIYQVADDTIVSSWTERLSDATDRSGGGKKAIVPTWASGYNSGNATYVDETKGTFVDTAAGDHGTAVEMALIDAETWSVGDIARGRDWARGVRHLQELGYDIPVWTPDAETASGRDEMPFWSLRRAARTLGVVDEDGLVERESDGDGDDTYLGFPDAETYNAALEAVEEAGFETGREPATPGSYDGGRTPVSPLDREAVFEPRLAWQAAAEVDPADTDVDLKVTAGGDAWVDPATGDRVSDVIRAVAIATGEAADHDAASQLDGEAYFDLYQRARTEFSADLPVYVDAERVVDDIAATRAAVEHLRADHVLDNLDSEITVAEPRGDAAAVIDPTWEDSESGERIVAFADGPFYCRKHNRPIDPLRVVALEAGLLDHEAEMLRGQDYLDAYEVARTAYDAPLPEISWLDSEATPEPDHEVVLPPAEELLEEFTTDAESLQWARDDVEDLYRDAADRNRTADLLTPLPALGKSTSAVKTAADEPTLLAAPRRELQQEYADKATDHDVSNYILPVFAEPWEGVSDDAVDEAIDLVREESLDLLRERGDLLDRIESDIDPGEPDDETVTLDRATCDTAAGEYGTAWALVAHVAHQLGLAPQTIHDNAEHLFGDEIPCCADSEEHPDGGGGGEDGAQDDAAALECPYPAAWERVADPDRPVDLLIGGRVHAHVESARTYYARSERDTTIRKPRTVVLDEFPGDDYGTEWGEDAPQVATWLATTIVDEVEDLTGLQQQVSALTDSWVREWLAGDGKEALGTLANRATAAAALVDLYEQLDGLRDEHRTAVIDRLLESLADGTLGASDAAATLLQSARGDLEAADLPPRVAESLADTLGTAIAALEDIDTPLAAIPSPDGPDIGAGLQDLFLEGLAPLTDGIDPDAVNAQCAAARTAETVIAGGADAVRELVVRGRDPYAHPSAHLLLAGMIIGGDEVDVLELTEFGFDDDREQTRVDRVEFNGATILWDRNQAGAYVLNPPTFESDGRRCSVIGLDATGRKPLWDLAIGEDVVPRDIHKTPSARRHFLKDTLNLQVVCTDNTNVRSYSGSPASKNFGGDLELTKRVADEYGGQRLRADTITATTDPGLITTKKVLGSMGEEFEEHVGATDNYWNVTGSNDLDEHNTGIVLGVPHPGDAVIERWGALGGEEMTRSGHGTALDYGSSVANSALRYVREDQFMQAVLRFGRDEEGALVFAHTAIANAIEELPVVADGAVVSSHSKGGRQIRNAILPQLRGGESFTVSDILEDVDISRRTVQRKLAEFEQLGYLERVQGGAGRATVFDPIDDPGTGVAELPDTARQPGTVDPDNSHIETQYTGSVGVRSAETGWTPPSAGATAPALPPRGPVAGAAVSSEGDPPPKTD